MKIIVLTNGKECIVNEENYEELAQFNWYESPGGYAKRHKRIDGKLTTIFMHRLLMNCSKEEIVDHINQNRLDNRKENLRIANKSTNGMNRNKQNNNSSGYKGVYYDKRDGSYDAYINKEGKRYYLGRFKEIKEAAKAYNKAAIELHGEFARLNEV